MDIKFSLDDSDFTAEDLSLIKQCLGVDDEDASLQLTKLAKSAFLEYRKMFIGRGLPTRADEVMQDRLLFLIQNYFIDRLPLESEICSIFQLPPSQSRTLLRNTKSRFGTVIDSVIKASIRAILEHEETVHHDEGHWEMVIKSDVIREEMNFIVGQSGPMLRPITKMRDSANKYRCAEDTYDLLSAAVE